MINYIKNLFKRKPKCPHKDTMLWHVDSDKPETLSVRCRNCRKIIPLPAKKIILEGYLVDGKLQKELPQLETKYRFEFE